MFYVFHYSTEIFSLIRSNQFSRIIYSLFLEMSEMTKKTMMNIQHLMWFLISIRSFIKLGTQVLFEKRQPNGHREMMILSPIWLTAVATPLTVRYSFGRCSKWRLIKLKRYSSLFYDTIHITWQRKCKQLFTFYSEPLNYTARWKQSLTPLTNSVVICGWSDYHCKVEFWLTIVVWYF